jgi:hypothetical protein
VEHSLAPQIDPPVEPSIEHVQHLEPVEHLERSESVDTPHGAVASDLESIARGQHGS